MQIFGIFSCSSFSSFANFGLNLSSDCLDFYTLAREKESSRLDENILDRSRRFDKQMVSSRLISVLPSKSVECSRATSKLRECSVKSDLIKFRKREMMTCK